MLRNLCEKLGAKFPTTTRCYFMEKIARLHDGFSEFFEMKTSPVEGQSLQQKKKKLKKRKRKDKKKKLKKMTSLNNFDFCPCLSKNVIKPDASGKKGMQVLLQMHFLVDWSYFGPYPA